MLKITKHFIFPTGLIIQENNKNRMILTFQPRDKEGFYHNNHIRVSPLTVIVRFVTVNLDLCNNNFYEQYKGSAFVIFLDM